MAGIKQALLLVMGAGLFALQGWAPAPALRQQQSMAESALSKWKSNDYSGVEYVSDAECGQCHASHLASQTATPMARALQTIEACQILASQSHMQYHEGSYTSEISRRGNASIYGVSDGTNSIAEPILYAFGDDVAGQTYVLRHNGTLYESRLSYFQAIRGLDITTGHTHRPPTSLEEALGRPIGADETRNCFSCHGRVGAKGSNLQFDRIVPGVGCQRCHGPGEQHIAAIRAGRTKDPQIFNPRILTPDELSQEFCGTCHRSFDQVMEMPGQAGLVNVRFQPYRIFNSRGHNLNDPRMSCIACHDPHGALRHDDAFYDSKCLACHISSRSDIRTVVRSENPCLVAVSGCVTCHMPKIDLPEMHFKFTDHWIRVVKPGNRVPR